MVQQYEYLANLNMATKEQADMIKTQIDLIKSDTFSTENPPKGMQWELLLVG
jgi:predicted glycosyltransferase